MRLAIGTIFKDESPYILEWIAFHRHVGVDKFFVADNGSNDGSTEILSSLDRAGVITHIPFPHVPGEPPQLPAYRHILDSYRNEADWFAFIDADEFLIPTDANETIKPLLRDMEARPDVGAVAVNWATYGSSGHSEAGDGLVLERFTARAEKNWSENFHYKSIVRSAAVVRPHGNPHLFVLREGARLVHTDGRPVVTHERGLGLSKDIVWDRLRLNHYVVKSKEEFFKRKGPKGRATVVGQKKGEGYFLNHDRNEVIDAVGMKFVAPLQMEIGKLERRIENDRGDASVRHPARGAIDATAVSGGVVTVVGWSILDDGKAPGEFALKLADDLLLRPLRVKRVDRPDVVRKVPNSELRSGFALSFDLNEITRDPVAARQARIVAGNDPTAEHVLPPNLALWPGEDLRAAIAHQTTPDTSATATRQERGFRRGHVDRVRIEGYTATMTGWAIGHSGSKVTFSKVKIGDVCSRDLDVKRNRREDVLRVYPHADIECGYSIAFSLLDFPAIALASEYVELYSVDDETEDAAELAFRDKVKWLPEIASEAVASVPWIPNEPTMPVRGVAALAQYLNESSCFLEYGSGGSTIMANAIGVPVIVSVESSRKWLDATRHKIRGSAGQKTRHFIHVDIGRTKEWGFPSSEEKWKEYNRYALFPWQECKEMGWSPDIVLVDGRFRVACCLASFLFASPGCLIFFDDYGDRPYYRAVEKFAEPFEMIDRVALFRVPQELPRDDVWLELLRAVADNR